MAFMESAFSPGWTNRIKMIMPETQMSVPIDEYIRNINWNALMPNINNGNRKERTNAYPLYPSRLDNMPPYPPNIGGGLRPNSLLNPNHIPIRHVPPPPMISRTNSFPIGGGGCVQGQKSPHHHHGQHQIQQQQGQQNQNHQGNRSGNEKYKTSLCKSFVINGVCKYGTQCLFAHGEHEIRPCPPFNHQNQPQQNISTVTRALNHNAHPPHGINNNNVNGANHRNHNIPPPSTVHNNAGNNNGRGDLRSPPFHHHHHQNVGSPPIRHPNMNNNQNANAHPPPNAHNNNNNNGGPAGRNNHPSGGGGHHHNKMSNNNKRPSAI